MSISWIDQYQHYFLLFYTSFSLSKFSNFCCFFIRISISWVICSGIFFFCNSLTTYSHSSKKYLQMIVVTFSANRIHQNCCQTNSLRTSFWYLIVVKIRANLSIVRFFLAFRYFSLHTDSLWIYFWYYF